MDEDGQRTILFINNQKRSRNIIQHTNYTKKRNAKTKKNFL